ncbi:MAG: hypothetical protein Q3Y08_02840 [Butyricicoccus sp.]|nr:hypothetical protein [Butyricicoccus sp.]
MARPPKGWPGMVCRAIAVLLAAILLSGVWMLIRECNTMGIVNRTDAVTQMQQARAGEQ